MERILKINSAEDILPAYLNSPISRLLEYHNLDRPYEAYNSAELLIGMCMDNRKHLHIPENFAYIIRSGGANLRYSEFRVSYAIAVGGVKAIALIGHNNCGMVNLMNRFMKSVMKLILARVKQKECAYDTRRFLSHLCFIM